MCLRIPVPPNPGAQTQCYYERVKTFVPLGAIFDVDDTLLDNQQGRPAGDGLHDHSRLAAIHQVGERRNIATLLEVTADESHQRFLEAPTHTIDDAVWGILWGRGLVPSKIRDPDHPLLREIMAAKNQAHYTIIAAEAMEVPGSTAFVHDFATLTGGRVAAASGGTRADIDLYFGMVGLDQSIQPHRIITQEIVTHPKPHPEMFRKGFASLDLPDQARHRVIGFEDDPRGIQSIQAAGLYSCAITTRYDRHYFLALPNPPDLICDTYAQFRQHFGLAT